MCALWTKSDDEAKRKQQSMFDLLADIRDQRSKIKLEFDEGVTSIKNLTATLVEYDRSGISVEVSSLQVATRAFDGADVTCFFCVRDRQTTGRELFLAFDTSVISVRQLPSGVVHSSLAFPRNLKHAQLRRSVRVKMNPRLVPELIVRPDFSGQLDPAAHAPVFGVEHMADRQFRIEDFSANGMRLRVTNALIRTAMPKPVRGSRYAISFQAVSEPGKPPQPFWVSAVLRNSFSDPLTGETSLGFEFIAEGLKDEKGGLLWRPLKLNEVSGLGKLVFKWNLDLYREKGLAQD